MAQSFDPVFGNWYTERQLGSGTDGKAFIIKRENSNGETERSVLKIIRIGDNRSEGKTFNSLSKDVDESKNSENDPKNSVKNITENIEIIQKFDKGKYFVKYEEFETRPSSDSKGEVVLIRMEEMRSLAEVLSQFSFTLDETVRLGVSVCRSLLKCRKFGYIYPNLKPENVLFDRNGICKLGDFGSFSRLEPSKTSIAYKRTEYYMAPEFIKTGKINCTADTYSLGLILYTLVNRGRLPFSEPYPAEITINALDKTKESRMQGLDFPEPFIDAGDLYTIIKKACAFKPEDRYLSPKQMLDDLENVLNHRPFSKMEYEDIYSVSDPKMLEEKEDIHSIVEEYEKSFDLSKKHEDPIFLRDEIQIPDIKPIDYFEPKQKQKQKQRQKAKRPASHAALPEIGKKTSIGFLADKKLLIFIIVAICILILFIVSLKIRFSADDAMIVSQQGSMVISSLKGLILNGI